MTNAEEGQPSAQPERSFHLIVNLASGGLLVHGKRLGAGDALLIGPASGREREIPSGDEIIDLRLGETWLRRWLDDPSALAGRRIDCATPWGRVLTAFASQLSPRFFIDSPLPTDLVADQLGGLLALVAYEMGLTGARGETGDA